MAVITVSRQLGSGGSYIATQVARELGLRYIDREIVQRAAEIAEGSSAELEADLQNPESVPDFINRVLYTLASMPTVPLVPSVTLREPPYIFDEATQTWVSLTARLEPAVNYPRLIRAVIEEFAREGNVMIVGRGGHVVLAHHPNVLRVLVIAPFEQRVRTIMERMQLSERHARKRVEQSDRDRAEYLKRYYGVNWLDPQHFDLVINTGTISYDLAVQLVCLAARAECADKNSENP